MRYSTNNLIYRQCREWNSKLRKQTMLLDRQIRNIQREEEKVKASLKQAAKKGDKDVCFILAKEIVNSRKAINRISTSKAQLNSVALHMTQQQASLRVAGSMQKSADVMKAMNNLVKVHEISGVMQELSREMMRAGIIEEMMEETLDEVSGIDEEEMEEQVQAEVDKVLFELTAGNCPCTFRPLIRIGTISVRPEIRAPLLADAQSLQSTSAASHLSSTLVMHSSLLANHYLHFCSISIARATWHSSRRRLGQPPYKSPGGVSLDSRRSRGRRGNRRNAEETSST